MSLILSFTSLGNEREVGRVTTCDTLKMLCLVPTIRSCFFWSFSLSQVLQLEEKWFCSVGHFFPLPNGCGWIDWLCCSFFPLHVPCPFMMSSEHKFHLCYQFFPRSLIIKIFGNLKAEKPLNRRVCCSEEKNELFWINHVLLNHATIF